MNAISPRCCLNQQPVCGSHNWHTTIPERGCLGKGLLSPLHIDGIMQAEKSPRTYLWHDSRQHVTSCHISESSRREGGEQEHPTRSRPIPITMARMASENDVGGVQRVSWHNVWAPSLLPRLNSFRHAKLLPAAMRRRTMTPRAPRKTAVVQIRTWHPAEVS